MSNFTNTAIPRTLAADLNAGATAITLSGSLTTWPAAPFFARIRSSVDSSIYELVRVRAKGTSSFTTMDRGVGGTAALDWLTGAVVEHVVTAEDLKSLPLNPAMFGADPTGASDSTTAVQACITAAIALGAREIVMPGTYLCGAVQIANATNLQITGPGKINWTGTASGQAAADGGYIGFELSGTCAAVTIAGLWMNGDGVSGNAHAGVWSHDSAVLTDIDVHGNRITNVAVGVKLGGTLINPQVSWNHIDTVKGTTSGYGYGISIATGTDLAHGKIAFNTVIKAERHSIYCASGGGLVVMGNTIKQHRFGQTTGASPLSGMVIARGRHITVTGNIFEACIDAAMSIEPDESTPAQACGNITVTGNTFSENLSYDIYIGTTDAAATFVVSTCAITGNTFRRPATANNTIPCIQVQQGKDILIANNAFLAPAAYTAQYSLIVIHAIGGATRTNKIILRNNTASLNSDGVHLVFFADFATDICTTDLIECIVENNSSDPPGVTTAQYLFDATVVNRYMVVDGVGYYLPGDTTPSVRNGVRKLRVANSGPVTITDLIDFRPGQIVTLLFDDANTTVNQANASLAGNTNFTSTAKDTLTLLKETAGVTPYWTEIARSIN